MKKFATFIPLLLIVFVVVLLFIKINMDEKHAADNFFYNSPMVGKKIPNVLLKTLDGKEYNFRKDAGKYTVINFFASWCISCLQEHKYFKELKGNKDINFIGVAWRDKIEDTKAWLDMNGNPYTRVLADSDGKFGILMGIAGIPETMIVDKDGIILDHTRGAITKAYIDNLKNYTDKKN